MFTIILLALITFIVLSIAVTMITVLGTIGVVFGSEIIVAVFIIWFVFFRKKKGNK